MRTPATILSALMILTGSSAAVAQQMNARTAPPAMQPDTTTTTRAFDENPESRRDVELEYRLESRFGTIRGLDVSNVNLHVVRGAVTLSGSVPTPIARDQLIGAVANTEGVVVLRDELVIASPTSRGGGPQDDAQTASRVRNVMFDDRSVVGNGLTLDVRSGIATVGGSVASFTDARHVVRRIRSVPGVKAVHSTLRIDDAPPLQSDPNSAF